MTNSHFLCSCCCFGKFNIHSFCSVTSHSHLSELFKYFTRIDKDQIALRKVVILFFIQITFSFQLFLSIPPNIYPSNYPTLLSQSCYCLVKESSCQPSHHPNGMTTYSCMYLLLSCTLRYTLSSITASLFFVFSSVSLLLVFLPSLPSLCLSLVCGHGSWIGERRRRRGELLFSSPHCHAFDSHMPTLCFEDILSVKLDRIFDFTAAV